MSDDNVCSCSSYNYGDPGRVDGEVMIDYTSKLITCTLPHLFPLLSGGSALYMMLCEGIRFTATRLLPQSIQTITSGMEFWGCKIIVMQEIYRLFLSLDYETLLLPQCRDT